MIGIAIVMASLIMSGCTSVQRMSTKMGINMGAPVVSLMIDVLKDTKSGRLAEKGFAGQLLMLTGMVELAPNNFRLLNDTSFLYCAYGIFMEDKEPQFAKELYDIGYEYGMRALKQNRKFRLGIEDGKKISELVPHLGKKYVPSLVWTALNKGLWIVLNMDDPEALMGMADTIALIKRSIELDETFYFGAGKMFLGAYYAMIPEYLGLGGGPENSEKMFKEARQATNGKFLLVSVLEARYLATTIDDRDMFEERLNFVLESDSGAIKGVRLINELSKMKARHYLNSIDKFF
jgi:hypothetical protein